MAAVETTPSACGSPTRTDDPTVRPNASSAAGSSRASFHTSSSGAAGTAGEPLPDAGDDADDDDIGFTPAADVARRSSPARKFGGEPDGPR